MKVHISVDMEGISGVVKGDQVKPGEEDYEKARNLMVKDTNAAIEGALEAGADEVVVNDSHDGMTNLQLEKLNPEARLISGFVKPLLMMEGVQEADAALFVGYHAKIGTDKGVLSHSFFGGNVNRMKMNGTQVGEPEINAALAGHFGVPVVCLSGGERVCKLVKSSIGEWVNVVSVKKDLSRSAAECLHPEKSKKLIKEGVEEALGNLSNAGVMEPELPVRFELEFFTGQMAEQANICPFSEKVDGRTVKTTGETFLEGFQKLMVLAKLGQADLF